MSEGHALLSQPRKLVEAIVMCIEALLSESSHQQAPSICAFNLKNNPTITIPNYLMRILNFMGCSMPVYVYSLILIDKILEENPEFKLTRRNVHRLLFTSIVVSAKFVDDQYYKNKFYSSVGGIPLPLLNQLEIEFMALIGYHCPVNPQMFNSYVERLDSYQQILLQENQEENDKKNYQNEQIALSKVEGQLKKRTSHSEVREKRERSRDRHESERNQETQESRSVQF